MCPHPVVARHYSGGLERVERGVQTEGAVPGSLSIYFVIVFAGLAFELIRGHIRWSLAAETLGHRSVRIQMSHKRKYKA